MLDVTAGGLPAVAALGRRHRRARQVRGARPAARRGEPRDGQRGRRARSRSRCCRSTGRAGSAAPDSADPGPGRTGRRSSAAVALRLDGETVGPATEVSTLINHDGPAVVEVDAVDETARLALTVTVELTVGGLVRTRATLTNRGDAVPARRPGARPAGSRRSPARSSTSAGAGARNERRSAASSRSAPISARAARAARDRMRPRCCTSAHPGSASPTARSGPCTPGGAATTPTTPSGCPPVSR